MEGDVKEAEIVRDSGFGPVFDRDLQEIEPEEVERQIHLQVLDPKAPAFLIEGVCCQAMMDINLSMKALAEWTPGEDITQLQSAQATCRIAAMAIKECLEVMDTHDRLYESRHSTFRRMLRRLKERLLTLEPCDPEIDDPNDYRICGSVKLICKLLQYGNDVLDVKSDRAKRRVAFKAWTEATGG